MKKLPEVSDAEMEVLQALWREGPGTVRDVMGWLGPRKRGRAYTTVQTLLNRLESKGHATVDKRGLAHVYRASQPREGFLSQRLRELSDTLCDGDSTPLVAALVSGRNITREDIERFKKIIDEHGRSKKKN